jgi:hypothetical protein
VPPPSPLGPPPAVWRAGSGALTAVHPAAPLSPHGRRSARLTASRSRSSATTRRTTRISGRVPVSQAAESASLLRDHCGPSPLAPCATAVRPEPTERSTVVTTADCRGCDRIARSCPVRWSKDMEPPPRRATSAVRRSRVLTRISSSVITVSPALRVVSRTTSNEAISASGDRAFSGRRRPARALALALLIRSALRWSSTIESPRCRIRQATGSSCRSAPPAFCRLAAGQPRELS